MANNKYDIVELREAVLTVAVSEKVELAFLLGDFNNEEELKYRIKEAKDSMKYSKNKDYKRTLKDLELFERILFGKMRDIPLTINGCFKELASWRLKHGR